MAFEGLIPFDAMFPEQARREVRTATVRGFPGLPDGDYGLLEAYCADPTCNCRRVMLNVVGRSQGQVLASVSYAFNRDDPDDPFPGPSLDPLNPQSQYAPALLKLVTQILQDPIYVARLECHYYQVKGAATDPTQPVQKVRAWPPAIAPLRPPINRTKSKRKKKRG
jgi:hypothetical protein